MFDGYQMRVWRLTFLDELLLICKYGDGRD
jgi:hypothetical protein